MEYMGDEEFHPKVMAEYDRVLNGNYIRVHSGIHAVDIPYPYR